MNHCEAIDMDITPTGAFYKGSEWPVEITVSRDLLDYLPGPHVSFGRFGVLRFTAINGYAVYRRFEDHPGGWNYRLVESQTQRSVIAAIGEPAAEKAARQFKRVNDGAVVDAFQWLPDAVPPVALPEWFVGADFEHDAKGELTIRSGGQPMKAVPADWIYRHGREIFVAKPEAFAGTFV